MTPEHLLRFAIDPALSLLPPAMTSQEARAGLVAIAWQESRIRDRRQVISRGGVLVPLGPAASYWQAELGGGFAGVLTHRTTAVHARRLCDLLDVDPTPGNVWEAVRYQDILAAGFARLLLWTLPMALPGPQDQQEGWRQYLDAWRPGKPHAATWPEAWAVGWGAVGVTVPMPV